MKILALDLSLTSTGYALLEGPGVLAPPAAVGKGMRRLQWIRDRTTQLAQGVDVVVIEGYSMGQKPGSSRSHSTGELGGVVRLALFEMGRRVVEVAPKSLKKYAANNGNAKKEAVFGAAIRRLGYQGSSFDEADALWLYTMAADHYRLIESPVPKAQREALGKVEWPVRRIAA